MNRRRKTDRARYVAKADKVWADLVKLRDKYVCQHCLTKYQQGDRGIEASHIIPRTVAATRWHPLNGKTLCTKCHAFWWHSNPTESAKWAEQMYPERIAYLNERKNLKVKYSTDDIRNIYLHLKATFDSFEGEFPSPYSAEVEFSYGGTG